MPNPYQRGTDLKHCPDYCAYSISRASTPLVPECAARPTDTCPREQAETTGYFSIVGEPRNDSGTLTVTPNTHTVSYTPTDALRDRRGALDRLIADYDGPLINPVDAGKRSVERMSGTPADGCATCDYYRAEEMYCDELEVGCDPEFFCGYWKERTNG